MRSENQLDAPGSPFRIACAAFLTALFFLQVYRAATQSLVHDEAFTYQLYLAGPFSDLFHRLDANLHFLAALLMRLSSSLFGFSELAMRLPTLAACAWYFVTVYRVSLLAFGANWLLLLSVVLASANPLLLDFLVAARGYGLAVALLTFAIYCAVRYLAGPRTPGLLVSAGISGGLAVTANLTAFFPVLAMVLVLAFVLRPREWPYLLAPLIAIGALFLALSPMRHAGASTFYYGVPTLPVSVRVLAALSLAHNSGLAGWNREVFWKPWWRDFAALSIAALTVTGMLLSLRTLRVRTGAAFHDWLLLIASWTFGGAWAVLFLAHHAVGLLYPLDRTGVCLLPFTGLLIVSLAARWRGRPRTAALARACAIVGTLIAVEYVIQLNWRFFYVWKYDADNRAIVNALAAERHPTVVRLGVSWPLEPSLSYYREVRGLSWLQPLSRQGPDGDYDYYVLTESEQDRIARYGLHVIYRGAISGTVLAGR
ncbi:MAG TPA: glycosyltransferase family 39 protein [Bryobacteraceae bacterium]